ncbi:sigma-70 family RNA polymerase sigma factor [Flagellimonas flava]|uniref:RNA polymerase sigma-70 factor, ECF subfamily n=1 Tax=Flagellimonas flava TaxID=570519 RepID=A0A1M5INQ6_9FLAO|nr:sigma-70 family RNA polymerase sigma factor [Allomuricauda flava]SHG29958.1 RNA polymerase sigma-70 factor, ECF subfamily [Allomuricauda flava]
MQYQIESLYEPLYFYIKKRVGNQEDAKDLTQDVFYKLSKSELDSIENVRHWVFTIAKNTITDYYRQKRIFTENADNRVIPDVAEPHDVSKELSECIDSFIDFLPEEYRTLLKLSELDGISQKQIAEQTGMNYVTVRSKIQRGRKKLRAIFAQCCVVTQGGKGSILGYEQRIPCNQKGVCR